MTKNKFSKKISSIGEENGLSFYLKEINKFPLLTRQEERDFAHLARQGDTHAKEQLLRGNLKFVVNVAKKYQNQGLPLADLISEGNIGLMKALEKYDVDRGYHFISYAVWWIRQAILKAIYEKSRMIRLPLNRANELVEIEKVRRDIQHTQGEEPDNEEIARGVNMTANHVAEILNIGQGTVSLETPVTSEREAAFLGDFIEDRECKNPPDQAMESVLVDEINKMLDALSEKESKILQYRFGLNGYRPHSLKEIGDKYNLTKERIRQIEKKAINRLRHSTLSQHLEAYIA